MRSLRVLFLATLALSIWSCSEQQPLIIEGHGALYIIHNDDNSTRILSADREGLIKDTVLVHIPENLLFRYVAADAKTDVSFEFRLHERIKHSFRQEKPAKTLVVSDLHGHLDAFVAFLKGNGVVDDNLNWIFGANQLIMIGDFLDRGRDDNGIGWLTYKLEKEAEDAGGRLDYLIGNHDDMVMKDDLRYTHEAHFIFTAAAGIPYHRLYAANTEMGRWLRDKYLIITVGKNLFVHAGLGPDFLEKKYKIGEINELAWRFTGYPTNVKKELHGRNELLFGDKGPLWYRGLVENSEAHPPISSEDLDKVLKYYKADRIIVGHTEVDEVDWRYDGRVIAVNVHHSDNLKRNGTAGILIEGEDIFSVTYSGDKIKLN